jgi:hypothetical protein
MSKPRAYLIISYCRHWPPEAAKAAEDQDMETRQQ